MPSDSDNVESSGGQDKTSASRRSTRTRTIPKHYYGELDEVEDNSKAGVQTMEEVEEMPNYLTRKQKKTRQFSKSLKKIQDEL